MLYLIWHRILFFKLLTYENKCIKTFWVTVNFPDYITTFWISTLYNHWHFYSKPQLPIYIKYERTFSLFVPLGYILISIILPESIIFKWYFNSHPRICFIDFRYTDGLPPHTYHLPECAQTRNLQPEYVPWQGIKPTIFWCMGRSSNQLNHTSRA